MESNPLIIRVDAIPADGLDVDTGVSATALAEWLGKDTPFEPEGDGHLHAHVERLGEVVHVRGRVSAALKAVCSRCVEPVAMGLNSPLEIALFPGGKEPEPGPDGELEVGDMGIATYHKNQIDLGALIRDELFLELPMTPVCQNDCLGLCPSCGVNLNTTGCSCERYEPRWSAFREVKLN